MTQASILAYNQIREHEEFEEFKVSIEASGSKASLR